MKKIGHEAGSFAHSLTAIGNHYAMWLEECGGQTQVHLLWRMLDRYLERETHSIRQAYGAPSHARLPLAVIDWQWSRHWTENWHKQG